MSFKIYNKLIKELKSNNIEFIDKYTTKDNLYIIEKGIKIDFNYGFHDIVRFNKKSIDFDNVIPMILDTSPYLGFVILKNIYDKIKESKLARLCDIGMDFRTSGYGTIKNHGIMVSIFVNRTSIISHRKQVDIRAYSKSNFIYIKNKTKKVNINDPDIMNVIECAIKHCDIAII